MRFTVTVIAPGSMGAAVGARLAAHDVRVLTSLEGRSASSRERARAAGLANAGEAEIAGGDFILSIVPPGEAVGLAKRLAPALSAVTRKPVYVDCNAISPATVAQVEAVIGQTGCGFVDAGIIGGPPAGDYDPTIYASGEAARSFADLGQHGLAISVLDGPVGRASALKMSYAGITKGTLALGTAMILAATKAGVADALVEELAASQPDKLRLFQRQLPSTYGKAYRWVAEMEEIASFAAPAGDGLAEIYRGIARLYQTMADNLRGDRAMVQTLDAALARLKAG